MCLCPSRVEAERFDQVAEVRHSSKDCQGPGKYTVQAPASLPPTSIFVNPSSTGDASRDFGTSRAYNLNQIEAVHPRQEFTEENIMQKSSLLRAGFARLVHNRSLALSSVALGILFLVVPVFAQNPAPDPPASLPSAPSATRSMAASNTVDHSLTFGKRVRVYGHSVFSIDTVIGPALGAGISQAEDEPPEWRGGAEGYGRRFGSDFARTVISKTITFGVAAIDGEDPRYFPSESRSVWGRTQHAVAWAFVSPTASGRQIPGFSKLLGPYGAAFIANTWYPEFPANRATAGDAAVRGTYSLAASIGWHVAREFIPFWHKDSQ